MTGTVTASRTNTFTDARLRAVMPEVGADFYALAGAGIVSFDVAARWTEELTFVLRHQAANGFQLQLTYPNGVRVALRMASSRMRAAISQIFRSAPGPNLFRKERAAA